MVGKRPVKKCGGKEIKMAEVLFRDGTVKMVFWSMVVKVKPSEMLTMISSAQ